MRFYIEGRNFLDGKKFIMFTTYRNHILGIFLSLMGILITCWAIKNPLLWLDLESYEWKESYILLTLLPIGVYSIGLALIIVSIHLIYKKIMFSVCALILTSLAVYCFAAGTFYTLAMVGFLLCVALMWEIENLELKA